MLFKNFLVYDLKGPWNKTAGALEEVLMARPLLPCPALAWESKGWVPVNAQGVLVESHERHLLLAMGLEEKRIPGSAMKREVAAKTAALEAAQGFKPGRKQVREIKEAVTTEMLPNAFVKTKVVQGWIDGQRQRLIVNTSSASVADKFTSFLRETLEELPIEFAGNVKGLSATMTAWLSLGMAPMFFSIQEGCELRGGPDQSTIRFSNHTLDNNLVRQHLGEGLTVRKLDLCWNEQVTFTLDDALHLTKLKTELLSKEEHDASAVNHDAHVDFVLMTSFGGRLISNLLEVLPPPEALEGEASTEAKLPASAVVS